MIVFAGLSASGRSFAAAGFQAVVAMVGAMVAYFVYGGAVAESLFWGGICALSNGALLAFRMGNGGPKREPLGHLRMMYRSLLERFFVVMVLLAVGLRFLGMVPLAVVAGFVMGQVTLVLAQILLNRLEI